ncbi:MAG TPA: hypothetical protein VKT49_08790 [Bryobacteraceae bacterium]|nr:hypothetical protein [Bryobacteraceae bacterium]
MKKRRGDSGFAMLLVFLMAATIALTLYMEIPRVAFQSQRQKEQLLIERGEQYKRAIQLFVRTNGRYPGDLKDLESFNNRRFLRHKFIDPMTGKDDWRLVHINNGVLTDSVLNKQKPGDANQQPASTAGQYVGEQAGLGVALPQGQQTVNPALTRRRASDGGAAPAAGPDGQPLPGQMLPGQVFPAQPGAQPLTGQFPSQQFPGGAVPGVIPGQPMPAPGGPPQPFQAAQTFPGQVPGQPAQMNPNQVQAQPFPGALPGQPLNPNPGTPIPPEMANQPGAFNPGGLNPTGANPTGQPIPGRLPGFIPGAAPNNPNSPGQPYVGGAQTYVGSSGPYVGGGQYIGSQPSGTTPASPPPPFNPGQVNPQPVPAQPNFPGIPAIPQNPGVPQNFGVPQTPGAPQMPGTPQTATPGVPGQNPAADMINNILRNPRPGQTGTLAGGQQIGGGIAGVASKSDDPAIMVYNDHSNYNEWEFIFDYTKQQPLPNPNGGTIGTPAASLGSLPGSVPGSGSPLATPSATAGLGLNPGAGAAASPPGQTTAGQATPGQTAPGQAGAGQTAGTPKLPPGLRPGRP